MEADFAVPARCADALLAAQTFAGIDIAETMQPEHGDARRRALYRSAPQRVAVQWLLDQAAFDQFADWYEALPAGAAPFWLRVAAQGDPAGRHVSPRRAWWIACFAAPYRAETENGGWCGNRYRVTADLWLYGEPAATRPEISTRARGATRLRGGAGFEAPGIRAAGLTELLGSAYAEP